MRDLGYCWLCKDCIDIAHCFGRDAAEMIENEDTDELERLGIFPAIGSCRNYYPEIMADAGRKDACS